MDDLYLQFFGVRGSYPVPLADMAKYGGNTVSLMLKAGKRIRIFDSGTGIIELGRRIVDMKDVSSDIDIFLSHLHYDHIQGLHYFKPVFDERFRINIYGPEDGDFIFKDAVMNLFRAPYSPVGTEGIKAELNFIKINRESGLIQRDEETGLKISVKYNLSHPVHGVYLYKIEAADKKVIYATDIETDASHEKCLGEFIKGADILIHDSQYTRDEYEAEGFGTRGFGHSTYTMACENAKKWSVDKLFLFHYNPLHSDAELETILGQLKRRFKNIYLSRELEKINLRSIKCQDIQNGTQ